VSVIMDVGRAGRRGRTLPGFSYMILIK